MEAHSLRTFAADMLIDTHAHIYQPVFAEDSEQMLQRAQDAGIKHILLPNIDLESIPLMHALAQKHPQLCIPMMGLHPCDVKADFESVLHIMRGWFDKQRYVAVGEIGIDLYWDKTTLAIQKEAFALQLRWAKDLGLPVAIHARDSFDEIFEVLDQEMDERLSGVLHCFTGTIAQAQRIMDYKRFMMGIGGVLTYPKSGLDAVVKDIPLEYLILETDAPFLPPTPHRGKRNESAYVSLVARKLADIKGISFDEVERVTTENAFRLFPIETYLSAP